jgi:hypothetical protein
MVRSKLFPRVLIGVILASCSIAGYAQDNVSPQPSSTQVTAPVKTGKERLGGKASDEQRVDNCNVPLESRGAKIRPDECQQRASTPLTD